MEESKAQHESDGQAELKSLEQQIEYGNLYTHSVLSTYADRINENESFILGLIDFLVDKQGLDTKDLKPYIDRVKREVGEQKRNVHPGIALRRDPEKEEALPPPVNCAERLHLCKAACCKLGFALSPAEVESGKIKWELGRPYHIRQEPSGYCSHIDTGACQCTIYQDRPKVCRAYSCQNDSRIWKDFDKMELNQEWIDANIKQKMRGQLSIKMNPQT